MTNVREIPEDRMQEAIERVEKRARTGNGDPPDNGGMEARVTKLEDFAQDTRDRLARIEATMATREDVLKLETRMHEEFHKQTWRFVGAVVTFGGVAISAVYFIARNVH